jgi:hypothetical protein
MSRGKKLNKTQQDRWQAFADATKDLTASANDETAGQAELNSMQQIAKGLDSGAFLNAFHIPKDAGRYEKNIESMLARIPDGWGRWISCDKGWYPIIAQFDAKMKVLAPNYQIHQIKEKYGRLDIYFDLGEERTIPDDPAPAYPGGKGEVEAQVWEEEHIKWSQRLEAYLETPAGKRQTQVLEQRSDLAHKLADMASQVASRTCEACAAPGELCLTKAPSPWYKTLCAFCAGKDEYLSERQWQTWWQEEEPKFRQRQKDNWRSANEGKKFALVAKGSAKKLGVPVVRLTQVADLERLFTEEWDGIFIANDGLGKEYYQLLVDKNPGHIQTNQTAQENAKTNKTVFIGKSLPDMPQIYLLDNKSPEVEDAKHLALRSWLLQSYMLADEE